MEQVSSVGLVLRMSPSAGCVSVTAIALRVMLQLILTRMKVMTNPITTLSRERLEQLADENTICKVSWDERIEMSRALLAVMDAKPVAFTFSDEFSDLNASGNWRMPSLERRMLPRRTS